MKVISLLLTLIVLSSGTIGCQVNNMPVVTTNPDPTQFPIETFTLPSPTATVLNPATRTPEKPTLLSSTSTPGFPAEANLRTECLEMLPTLPENFESSGVIVLEDFSTDTGDSQIVTLLLDMATGQTTQISLSDESLRSYGISPNREQVAFSSIFFDDQGKIASRDLVITDALGQRIKVIPHEDDWLFSPGWLDDQHLGITLAARDLEENNLLKPGQRLILNPFTGEKKILDPDDYPGFLYTPSTVLPDWEGWNGVVYDPTLSLVIYPHLIENEDDMYTYAVWNLTEERIVATLENIFSTFTTYNFYPMPRWSPDGTQFVFEGVIAATEESDKVEFELYRVSQDGSTERLTHLADVGYVWPSSYSWSPDGRHIAFFVGPPLSGSSDEARLVILDTVSLYVTDYCVSVTVRGSEIPAPIWSPDGEQLLVTDRTELGHQNVILVDTGQGFAAQFVEDMSPAGWLLDPDR